jgi:hypothetical protein
MIKVILILICIFNILACKPAGKKLLESPTDYPFSCLSSQSDCVLDTELGQFSIEFSGLAEHGKLKTELPFHIQVQFSPYDKSHQLTSIDSYLEGKDMFMGKIPVFFQPNTKENKLQADTLLASCSEEVMTWRLWLTVDIGTSDEVKQQVLFIDFDSKRL